MYSIKRFSIESGAPDTPGSLSRELKYRAESGGIMGGIMGGLASIPLLVGSIGSFLIGDTREGTNLLIASGATTGVFSLIGAIGCSLTALGANRRASIATKCNMNHVLDIIDRDYLMDHSEDGTNRLGNVYRELSIDGNPSKFTVTIAYEAGKGVIVLNKPNSQLLRYLNDSLETIVGLNRKADYVSEKTESGYVIFLTLPDVDTMADLIRGLVYESPLTGRLNVLTEKSLKLPNK